MIMKHVNQGRRVRLALLAASIFCAGGCGDPVADLHNPREGATVERNEQGKITAYFLRTKRTDGMLSTLAPVGVVDAIVFEDADITDAGLAQLKSMKMTMIPLEKEICLRPQLLHHHPILCWLLH